jgi:hypothetical protein
MVKLATFGIYAGLVVFALLFVFVALPWLSRATGASPETVSIMTAALSFVVALTSYLMLRSAGARKISAGKKE